MKRLNLVRMTILKVKDSTYFNVSESFIESLYPWSYNSASASLIGKPFWTYVVFNLRSSFLCV